MKIFYKLTIFAVSVILIAANLISCSCGDYDECVNGITLDKTLLTLNVGGDTTLVATVTPTNAIYKTVAWSSSDESIATVSDGKVIAKAVGTATITAKADTKTATCEVTVTPKTVESIKLNKSTTTLIVGGNETLVAKVEPDDAANKNVTWKSDKTDIATVDASGKVTALKVGKATITATTEEGGFSVNFTIISEAPDFSGAGTEANPYQIKTQADMETLSTRVNGGKTYEGQYLKLMNNINLEGSETNQWTAIGTKTQSFYGSFDGNNKTISGLYINKPTSDYQGLFGCTSDTSLIIKNLTVSGSVTGKEFAGGIVGNSYAKIENCHFSGSVKGEVFVGGIAGCNTTSSIINCTNSGNIEGIVSGGITGYTSGNVFKCSNSGTITGISDTRGLGGIVGDIGQSSSFIVSCHNSGNVKSEGSAVGGIAGIANGTISSCYNTAEVSGVYDVGGIAGNNDGVLMTACYNKGVVKGTSAYGGICGQILSDRPVTSSYCLNAIDGGTDTAVGYNEGATSDVVAMSKSDMTTGTLLNKLNAATNAYNTANPSAPQALYWQAGSGTEAWPVFVE